MVGEENCRSWRDLVLCRLDNWVKPILFRKEIEGQKLNVPPHVYKQKSAWYLIIAWTNPGDRLRARPGAARRGEFVDSTRANSAAPYRNISVVEFIKLVTSGPWDNKARDGQHLDS